MANIVQQTLTGSLAAAAAGVYGTKGVLEGQAKAKEKAARSEAKETYKQQIIQNATAKAQDSLAAARQQTTQKTYYRDKMGKFRKADK